MNKYNLKIVLDLSQDMSLDESVKFISEQQDMCYSKVIEFLKENNINVVSDLLFDNNENDGNYYEILKGGITSDKDIKELKELFKKLEQEIDYCDNVEIEEE